MAAPSIVGSPVETAISTAGTSHVVSLPSGTAGNMFVAIMSKGSAGTTPSVNTLTGWQELLDEAIVLGLYVAVKECDGTEGATTTFTLSSATRGAWIVYEVTGQALTATQLPEIGTTATGSSTTPNPPSRSVTNGPKDVLCLAFFGRSGEATDDDTWVTASPSTPVAFGNRVAKTCGTAGTNLAGLVAVASATANTASVDPGTFTAATGAWRANTVVIHPAPANLAIAANLDASPTIAANLTVVEKYFDDDFPGGSLNARWNITAGAPSVASGLLNLDIEAAEGIVSAVTKDLTGNQIAWRTDTFPSGSGAPFAYCTCYIDATHYVSFLITETNIQATKNVGAGFASMATSAIDATANRWMRIKESGGTTYWQISPDGTTWTTLYSEANPITMTALNLSFETSPDGTEVSDWKIDRIRYASGADTLAIAAALDVSPALAVALGRETFVAANLSLTPTLAVALLRETFIAANLPITPTLAAALSRETFIAAAHDLGLTMAVNLEVEAPVGTEYFIAASLDLGFNAAAALGRETFVSANLPLDLQMAAALTREMFIAAALNMPVTVAVNMTRETFIAASLDLGQAAEVRLILDMMIAANFPIGLPVTVNIRIEGGPVQMYIYRTLLGVG